MAYAIIYPKKNGRFPPLVVKVSHSDPEKVKDELMKRGVIHEEGLAYPFRGGYTLLRPFEEMVTGFRTLNTVVEHLKSERCTAYTDWDLGQVVQVPSSATPKIRKQGKSKSRHPK